MMSLRKPSMLLRIKRAPFKKVALYSALLLMCVHWVHADVPEASLPIEQYHNAIERVEAEQGAYATELADLYLGLGRALVNDDSLTEAQRALQRGMQIERVNLGLDSLSQTPYLYLLADLDASAGDHEAAQEALDAIYRISANNFGATDARMLEPLNQILSWQLQQYHNKPAKKAFAHVIAAEYAAQRIARVLNTNIPMSDPRAPKLFKKLATVQYLIAEHVDRYGLPSESGFQITSGASGSTSSQSVTGLTYYRRGKSALESRVNALTQQPAEDPIIQASAIADLADWYLLFGQIQSARKTYQVAYETLSDDRVDADVRNTFFSEPVKIDFSATSRQDPSNQKPVQINLWITATGRVKNIEFVDPKEKLEEQEIRAIRSSVRSSRFRPRLTAGVPEAIGLQLSWANPAQVNG